MKSRHIVTALLVTLSSHTLWAQQDSTLLDRSLVIEKEYTPIVQEATKINEQPAIETPRIEKSPIRYASWASPASFNSSLVTLSPTPFATTPIYHTERGYVQLGGGNHNRIVSNAGYRILNNQRDSLALWVLGNGFKENSSWENSDKTTFRYLDEAGVNLAYKHAFNRFTLRSSAHYDFSKFNYYGSNDTLASTTLLPNQEVQDWGAEVAFAFKTNPQIEAEFSIGFNRYDNLYGASLTKSAGVAENHFWVDGSLGGLLKENLSWKVGLEGDQLSYNHSDMNYAILSLKPRLEWSGEKLDFQAGIVVNGSQNDGVAIRLAPDVKFEWEFAPQTFLYANAEGGKQLNTLQRMSQINRYASPSQRVGNSYTPYDLQVGLRNNYWGTFWIELYGGYKRVVENPYTMRWAMNQSPVSGVAGSTLTAPVQQSGVINYLGADMTQWRAGAMLTYRYDNVIRTSLHLRHNEQLLSNTHRVVTWDTPATELDFALATQVIPKLELSANYYMGLSRSGLIATTQSAPTAALPTLADCSTVALQNIHDLSLGANYTWNKNVTIYAQLHNLLFQRYDRWYGMPAEGFNFRIGISTTF